MSGFILFRHSRRSFASCQELFEALRIVEETNALQFRWPVSETHRLFLDAVGLRPAPPPQALRSVLSDPKLAKPSDPTAPTPQNGHLPSQWSFDNAQSLPSCFPTEVEPSTNTSHLDIFAENPLTHMQKPLAMTGPSTFDWTQSAFSNPITCISKLSVTAGVKEKWCDCQT